MMISVKSDHELFFGKKGNKVLLAEHFMHSLLIIGGHFA